MASILERHGGCYDGRWASNAVAAIQPQDGGNRVVRNLKELYIVVVYDAL